MAATMPEDSGTAFHKGLSEWWSEETEYVFQRIERWAALARGYNRLRSQRLSRGRMTMSEDKDPRWTISSNKLIIDDSSWTPHFYSLKRSHRRRNRPEETKIDCCGTLSYQSNGNLDSKCLESYSYDHSIYFKTIGDIRSSKRSLNRRNNSQDVDTVSSEGLVDSDIDELSESIDNHFIKDDVDNNNRRDSVESWDSVDQDTRRAGQTVWPIVDLAKLDLSFADADDVESCSSIDTRSTIKDERNNNCHQGTKASNEVSVENVERLNNECKEAGVREESKSQEGIKRFLSFRKTRRRTVKQPPVLGENKVVWPGVLLNYTKNIDPTDSPHNHYVTNTK